jgi:hypothetical protein
MDTTRQQIACENVMDDFADRVLKSVLSGVDKNGQPLRHKFKKSPVVWSSLKKINDGRAEIKTLKYLEKYVLRPNGVTIR